MALLAGQVDARAQEDRASEVITLRPGMRELRERGIYKLPGGRELVALPDGQGGYMLCDPAVFRKHCLPEYLVDAEGWLLAKGERTVLTVDDLEDTGRTAQTP